jgi:hypothetical protein
MKHSIEIRAYQALVQEIDNEVKVVEAQYDKEFARVCMLIRVIAELVPNPQLVIQEVQDRLNKDGDTDNNFVQFYRENYELEE